MVVIVTREGNRTIVIDAAIHDTINSELVHDTNMLVYTYDWVRQNIKLILHHFDR